MNVEVGTEAAQFPEKEFYGAQKSIPGFLKRLLYGLRIHSFLLFMILMNNISNTREVALWITFSIEAMQ